MKYPNGKQPICDNILSSTPPPKPPSPPLPQQIITEKSSKIKVCTCLSDEKVSIILP